MPPPKSRSRRSRSRSSSRSSSRTPSPYFSRRDKPRGKVPPRGSRWSRSRSPHNQRKRSRNRSPRRRTRTPEKRSLSRKTPPRRHQSPSKSHSQRGDKRQVSPKRAPHRSHSPKRSRSRSPREKTSHRTSSRSRYTSTDTDKHRRHSDEKGTLLRQFRTDETSEYKDLVKHVETEPGRHGSHQRVYLLDSDTSHQLPPKTSSPIFPLEDLAKDSSSGRLQYRSEYKSDDTYQDLFTTTRGLPEQVKVKPTLHERFREEDHQPIDFEDNITISIHRNVKGNAPPVIQRNISPDDVIITRREGEGQEPFSLREEFQTKEVEIVEKRTIQVSGPRSTSSAVVRLVGDFENYLKKEEPRKVIRAADDDYGRLPKRNIPDMADRELERRMKRSSDIAAELRSRRGVPKDPSDLRFNLSRKRGISDARERIGDRKFDTSPSREDRRGMHGESRTGSDYHRDGKELPDFSKRPDKFTFEEWRTKPDMVPKGISYFEHDNRGEIDYWAKRGRGRGRGRGFFRGRGRGSFYPYSGRGRGRGSYGSFGDSTSGPWKHDKFEELSDGDNKPSSTTEK